MNTLMEAEFVTGIPINFGTFASLFEGISSTIFQFLPLIVGILVITIAGRVVPYILSRIIHK